MTGWFPASYVKLLESKDTKGDDAPAPAVGEEAVAAPAVEEEAVTAPATETGGEMYRALYAYAGQNDDELAFEAGDVIAMINKEEPDWWKGRIGEREGVFPSNYVEPADAAESELQ